jgi:hypothetical protein
VVSTLLVRTAAVAVAASTLAACGGLGSVATCGEIPAGGCPAGRGGSCDDAACAGLYDCVDGDWTLTETCSGGDASTSTSTSAGSSTSTGAGGCAPVELDHSGEVEGCTPDLESPDCPAAAVEVCGNPCETGCVDFFMCEEGGWQDVAYCADDGTLTVTQGGG